MAKEVSFKRLATYWPLYGFVLPSAVLVALFAYFPAASAMYHAFYRWNGDYINKFLGLGNFRRALGTPSLWIAAVAIAVAIVAFSRKEGPVARLVKLAGSLGTMAVTLVVLLVRKEALAAYEGSMVTAILVWAVPWLLCFFLMARDNDWRIPVLTIVGLFLTANVLRAFGLDRLFAWVASMLIVGGVIWHAPTLQRARGLEGLRAFHAIVSSGILFWALAVHAGGDQILWRGFTVISILVVANIVKMVPSIATAVVIHRLKSEAANYWYRVLFVVPMIIPGMVYLLIWKYFFEANSIFNLVLHKTGIMALLVRFDAWFGWGGVFKAGVNPIWLNDTNLVLPALILWGFPWVGVVGVLIYLAGLQGIGDSVYEAADLDGVTPFQKFLHIEFPLIMTQVRINLVLLIIGTLQMYAFILILFDIEGGPNGKLMVPGLYMFRSAFAEGYAGYACCIGLIIFVFILLLTEINNRFVRVEK